MLCEINKNDSYTNVYIITNVPTKIQYMEKYFSLAFLTNSIIHLQANNPDKNAAKNPIKRGRNSTFIEVAVSSEASKYILAVAPKIKGSTIKNENLAAFDLSSPNKMEVEMVEPERDIPGSRAAKACAIPIMNESLKLMSLPVFLALSAMNSKVAVINNIKPTNRKLENNSSSVSLRNTPTNAAGIIDKTIFKEKRNSSFLLN